MWEGLKTRLAGDAAEDLAGLSFEFNAPLGTTLCVLLILGASFGSTFYFWPHLARLKAPLRVLVTSLRAAILLLALFMLLDPCIVGQRVEPGKHYVVVLFDDSKSMQIVGADGRSRGERLLEAYEASLEEFEEELRKKYQVALYRFGGDVERIEEFRNLEFDRPESDLVGAVEESLNDLEGVHVSGVVLFSDGIQQGGGRPPGLDAIADASTPIFTVGTDSESEWRDVHLGHLGVKRTQFDKSPLHLTIPIKATGLAGSTAIVEVISDNRVVESQTMAINDNSWEREVRMEFVPQKKGWLDYEARVRLEETGPAGRVIPVEEIAVPGKDGVTQNNSRWFTIDNRDKEYQILYFAGRPNWENKFVSRALKEDKQLRLTSLIRISSEQREFKYRGARSAQMTNPLFSGFDGGQDQPRYDEAVFLRLDIRGTELQTGYPQHPEELFPYHLVIWGDIESKFFSEAQLELTREYVSKRGGSLLFLGGPSSFTEGGYEGTIIESMMPVMLRESAERVRRQRRPENLIQKFKTVPTVEGELSGTWLLDPDPIVNQGLWAEMPELSGINLFVLNRAGATVLAEAKGPWPDSDEVPLYAIQRYGEGKSALLATGATWQWQMDLDKDDDRHERLWRQIVRGLVTDVPERIVLRNREDAYTVGEKVELDFVIRDKLFDEREGLRTTIDVKTPSNQIVSIPVDESIHETGLYSTEFVPDEIGTYLVSVTALNEKDEVVSTLEEEAILVEPDQREFKNPQYNPSFLQRVAEESGGGFFTLDRIGEIAGNIPWVDQDRPSDVRIHLWHWPGFFFALIAMLALEWYVRRKKGLA